MSVNGLEKRPKFTPIHDLGTTSRIHASRFRLPGDIQHKIGFNERKIGRLLQLGGSGELDLTTRNSDNRLPKNQEGGDHPEFSVSSKSTWSIERPFPPYMLERASWRDITASFNVYNIQQEIAKREESELDPAVWAKEIDKYLRQILVQIGVENLCRIGVADAMGAILTYSVALLVEGSYIYFYLGLSIPLYIFFGFEQVGYGLRHSLVSGIQADRILLLWLDAKFGQLVAPING